MLLQSDSYFPDGNWFEQWITLDHRSREEHRSLHLSGNYGLSSDKSWMNLHNLYLDQWLPSRNFNLRLGRFDRYDPSGVWTLDGISLQWKRNGGTLEVYGGAPRRVELYYAPGREDEDAHEPEGEYLAGVMLSQVLEEASSTGLRNAHWGLGLRRYGAGDHAWRLDGHFSGTWESSAETPPMNFIAALVLDVTSPELESFDLQITMPLRQRGQLVLRGRRYEPPAKSLTFRDRYYSYFASGNQTLVEAGYEDALDAHTRCSGYLRFLQREQGLDGTGAEFTLSRDLQGGQTIEGHAQWLQGEGEHSGGIFFVYGRPLNTRLLLDLNAALRHERTSLSGSRTILAGEARLQWMWNRDLHLDATVELAHSDGGDESYRQARFGLRLVYSLPATGMEDYR